MAEPQVPKHPFHSEASLLCALFLCSHLCTGRGAEQLTTAEIVCDHEVLICFVKWSTSDPLVLFRLSCLQ